MIHQGVSCTLALFLGGWSGSGGTVKMVPSARWEGSVTDTYPAAVIRGIIRRVWSPVNKSHTALKEVTHSYPCRRKYTGKFLWIPKWAFKASRTAGGAMVRGLRPQTSVIGWRDATDPTNVYGAGQGAGCTVG